MSKAYRIYLTFCAFSSALYFMAFTVNSIYRVKVAGLDALQLVLVGTFLEMAAFLFEVPTGIVADLYSRRLSIIIGVFLIGLGFLLEGFSPLFYTILLAQVIWGIGYTFTSGALQAWISDEIGEEKTANAFMRGEQFSQLGALVGTLVSTVLVAWTPSNYPIILSGMLLIGLGFFLILQMPETGFHPAPTENRTTYGQFFHTFQQGLALMRRRPTLRSILWIGLFLGMYSEGYDRLWLAHLLEQFSFPYLTPEVWFGIMQAVSMLLAVGVTELAQRRLNLSHPASLVRAMAIASALLVLSLLVFSLAGNLWVAVLFYLAIGVFRNLISPLHIAWVNHRLDSQVRATMISMSSQVDALGQIGGGPLIGIVARQVSLRAGLLGSTLLLTPVLWLFRKQLVNPEK